MKLYYSPGAGAMASHITIRELNLDVELIRVDVQQTHQTATGEDYYKINPKGYVPFLAIDNETSLSEGAVILQYLADQDAAGKMFPGKGSPARYAVQEWVTFIGTEPQRLLGSFFIAGHLTEDGLAFAMKKLQQRLTIMDQQLARTPYLVGDKFTIADAYAFTILNWIPAFGLNIDLGAYKHLSPYLDKVRNRDSVQTAMKEEGLL